MRATCIACDQVQHQIQPGSASAGHHQALALARHHQRALRVHGDLRITLAEDVAPGPVRGCLVTVEQPGLGEQHRTRTGGRKRGAFAVPRAQPVDFSGKPSGQGLAGREQHLGHADDVG